MKKTRKQLARITALLLSLILLVSTTSCLSWGGDSSSGEKNPGNTPGTNGNENGNQNTGNNSSGGDVVSEDAVYFSLQEVEAFSMENANYSYIMNMNEYQGDMIILMYVDTFPRDMYYETGEVYDETETEEETDDGEETEEDDSSTPTEPMDEEKKRLMEAAGDFGYGVEDEYDYAQYQNYYFLVMDSDGKVKKTIDVKDILTDGIGSGVRNMSMSKDGTIYLTCDPLYSYGADTGEQNNAMTVYVLDSDLTTLVDTIKIESGQSAKANEYLYYYNFLVDSNGNIIATGSRSDDRSYNNILSVFDKTGKELFTLMDDPSSGVTGWSLGSSVVELDGTVYVDGYEYTEKDSFSWVAPIDFEKKELGKKERDSVLSNFYNLQTTDKGIFYYNDIGIYSVDIRANSKKDILLFKDLDLNTYDAYPSYYVLSEDKIFMNYTEYNQETYEETQRWYFLNRESKNPNAGKTILRIGGFGITGETDLKKMIFEFNKTSKDYRAEIYDYYGGDWSGEEEYQNAIKEMNMDILSGNTPDIIYGGTYALDFPLLAKKGLFVDLYTLMENDPEYNKEFFFENLMEGIEINGELSFMFTSFSVEALMGRKSLLGDRIGFTIDEFNEFTESLPSNMRAMPIREYESVLYNSLYGSVGQFVDESTSTVNFDSPEFKNLLMFCKQYGMSPDDMDYDVWVDEYELFRNGELALMSGYISSISGFNYDYQLAGESVAYVGYPSDINSAPIGYSYSYFAISNQSKHQDEAWELIKLMLGEEQQDAILARYNLPVRKSSFEKGIQKAMTPPDPNAALPRYYYEEPLLTEEGAKTLRTVVESIHRMAMYDESIMDIIREETQAFFAGEKDIDLTVRIIQDKVKTLINERS